MAVAFEAVFIIKHRGSVLASPIQSDFLKPRESRFPQIPNCNKSVSRHRLSASREFRDLSEAYEAPIKPISYSSFDSFLSGIEFLSLASSAAVCVYFAVKCWFPREGAIGVLGSKVLAVQCVVLICGLAAGTLIRRRQWMRISAGFSKSPSSGDVLLERVEKLEQDLRSCTSIIYALSRRIEKLGIRFRVFRKTLKQPIAETSALAQKASQAALAVAAQEDVLEKELGEIQNVLIAMQEQQKKQLELILAIGKSSKLWGAPVKAQEEKAHAVPKLSMDGAASSETEQMETVPLRKEGNNRA